MDYELEHSRIEQKNRELHKQGSTGDEEELHSLEKETFNVASDFSTSSIEKIKAAVKVEKVKTPLSIILLRWFAAISVSAALTVIGYFVYQYLDPSGRPSESNVLINIETPVGANPGEAIELTVKVENKNNIALDTADIVLQLPAGSYENLNGMIIPSKEKRVSLGLINAGETAEYKASAYILGGEQQLKDIKALLSYRFININSVFTKSAVSQVRVLASPVTVLVDTLKRTTAGRDVKTTINIKSNTEVPLKNILVSVEYPKGFVFSSAEPRPVIGNGLWVIDSLLRSDNYTFVIDGMFSSEGSVERILRTRVGVSDIDKSNEINSEYQEVLTPIALEAPFVDIKTTYNGKSPDAVTARYGVRMSGEITITNNTDVPISHAVVEVSIGGTGLDEKSVEASRGGIYRAQTNTITWDERSEDNLTLLRPRSSAVVTFSFVPDAGRNNGQYASNPEISTNVSVKAERENEIGVTGEVRTLSASIVKVATQAEFASRLLFYSGPIKNLGEMPPRLDKDTQLTVIWNVRNTSNSLDGAEVRAKLPPSVTWSGVIYPNKELVRYDSSSHEVIWVVGNVPAGSGVGSVPPKEVAFQIVLTPGKQDVNKFPTVIEDQLFRARDTFTGKPIEINFADLNTTLPSDSQADRNIGKVLEK